MADISELKLLDGSVANIKDATSRLGLTGKVDIDQGVSNAGKVLGIGQDGKVAPTTAGSGSDFTGATASTAGTNGLVPAPVAGDQIKVLMGSGDWDYASAAAYTFDLDTVTNTSGSYTHTTTISGVTADMKPIKLEFGDPDIFGDEITVTCNNGSIALSCDNVAGTSTVKVVVLKQAHGGGQEITSSEYDELSGRIGDLEDEKGAASGIATLDAGGKVPASQLPSYVDDVVDGYLYDGAFYVESTHETVITAEAGKIYVDIPTNASYRWSGSVYTKLSDYAEATTSASGLMSAADKTKLNGIATGATANVGTITGITMNGVSKGTSGVVDLGTVLTAHQDISGKANTSAAISNITRSGTTFTATRANGTTFTFDQQDTNTWPTALSQLSNDVGYITAAGNTWRPITNYVDVTDQSTSCSAYEANWIYYTLANALNGKLNTSFLKTKYLGGVSPSGNGNINLGIGSTCFILSVRCISTDDIIALPFLSSTHTSWWANLKSAVNPWGTITSGTYNFWVGYIEQWS